MKRSAAHGIDLAEAEVAELGSGDVRLKMNYAGICGSDIATYRWATHRQRLEPLLPFVLGHEGVGHVVQTADDVTTVSVGDRVVPEPLIPCRHCTYCLDGKTNLCPAARRLGSQVAGTMAEQLIVPETACYRVPSHLSDREAALLEVLAVAMHAARRAPPLAGARCAIVGPGSVGLCLLRAVLAMGAAEVTLFGRSRNASRLETGMAIGASRVIALDDTGAPPDVLGRYEAVFEAAGDPAALVLGAELVRPGGSLIALGGYQRPLEIDYSALLRTRGIDLLASRARIATDWSVMLSMLASGVLDVSGVPTAVFPLWRGREAFEAAERGTVIKALLDCRDVEPNGGHRG